MSSTAKPIILPESRYVVGHAMSARGREPTRLSVRRTRVIEPDLETALSWGGQEGLVARLNLVSLPSNEISQGRSVIRLPPRAAMETSFRNVREVCLWPMLHPIDQITFDLPRTAVADWAEDHALGKRLLPELMSGFSAPDAVLKAFGLAVLPVLGSDIASTQFFIDHILDGVCSYILKNYADGAIRAGGGLAPWQIRRAKEMMDAGSATDLSLSELASACGLSVAHFARAFRKSCGTTPHQWLMNRRLEKAMRLLRDSNLTLQSIAEECGFADQSHLTNTFSRRLGTPPGAMRRSWTTA